MPAAMSKTASRSGARVPPPLLDLLRSESQLHARKRYSSFFFFSKSRPAARPSLKTPARRLLEVTVAWWTCASKNIGKERGSPQVKSAMSNAWARQVGASSAWFYSLAWIFLSSPERFLRSSDLDPARQTETCQYEPCVNLALHSWNKVEVSTKHRVYGVRVLCLFLLLFVFLSFLFLFFFVIFTFLETGKVKTPPPPNGHARILVNAEIYGRSLICTLGGRHVQMNSGPRQPGFEASWKGRCARRAREIDQQTSNSGQLVQ